MGGGCHSGFVTAALGLLEPSCDSQNLEGRGVLLPVEEGCNFVAALKPWNPFPAGRLKTFIHWTLSVTSLRLLF